ncbi:phosphate transport system regulatory protein PhoU [Nitratireductor aestuarii]|uniref:Phosphate-specific transport system accessory protein PhoU n=1 Tax=Nitratireductor aestuarii TaxID=1735103 RepID=A0A916RZ93_9HYPH|nr:phosphate signaling complex protein PhoU [Nitratireductor aestuarii]GGA73615.1 phosphate transport system regulatory protein PhoU [Nitratireductor aestuarii]
MSSQHIRRSLDEDLRYITTQIAAMGGHAERMVEQSVEALTTGDEALARKIIQNDAVLDGLEREIGERAVEILARRQPMAGDLREIVGAIRISGDLERIGDLGKNIAKRSIIIGEVAQLRRLFVGFAALSDLAMEQLKAVLDAYAAQSVDRIASVRDRDREIDAKYTSLFREMLTCMMEDPANITPCTHLIFCAKNIERVGDHATNIAETVYHIMTGEQLPADRPKEDRSHVVGAASAGNGAEKPDRRS